MLSTLASVTLACSSVSTTLPSVRISSSSAVTWPVRVRISARAAPAASVIEAIVPAVRPWKMCPSWTGLPMPGIDLDDHLADDALLAQADDRVIAQVERCRPAAARTRTACGMDLHADDLAHADAAHLHPVADPQALDPGEVGLVQERALAQVDVLQPHHPGDQHDQRDDGHQADLESR